MAESREERIARALGWVLMGEGGRMEYWVDDKGKEMIVSDQKFRSLKNQARIRQRVRELLDELGFYYKHERSVYGKNHFNAINVKYDYQTHWFSDSELPKEEQNLLLWLTGKGGGIEQAGRKKDRIS